MTAFLNFILVVGVLMLAYIGSGLWIKRWRTQLKLQSIAKEGVFDNLDALDLREVPLDVLNTIRVISMLTLENISASLVDKFEAALVVENTHPSHEEQTAFLTQGNRAHLISASVYLVTLLTVRNPRRWKIYSERLTKDESLGLRALIWVAQNEFSDETRHEDISK